MEKEIKDLKEKQSSKVSGGNGPESEVASDGIGWVVGYYRKGKCEACHKQYKYYSHRDFYRDHPGERCVKPESKEDFTYACEDRFCPECLAKKVKTLFG